jgi:hypothetical protein
MPQGTEFRVPKLEPRRKNKPISREVVMGNGNGKYPILPTPQGLDK